MPAEETAAVALEAMSKMMLAANGGASVANKQSASG